MEISVETHSINEKEPATIEAQASDAEEQQATRGVGYGYRKLRKKKKLIG